MITATNRNLHKEISKGKFREDLYYRLNVLNIKIPALKERREDICEIGFHLYEQCSGNVSDEEQKFIRRILNKLEQYNWPGNVRELGNLMERIYVLLSQGEEQDFVEAYISSYLYFQENKEDATERLDEWEKNHILTELKKQNLEIGKTAEAMGISRSTLWRKIKKYGIEFR